MAMTRSTSASVGPKVAWVRKRAACSRVAGFSTGGARAAAPAWSRRRRRIGAGARRGFAAAVTASAARAQQHAGAQSPGSPARGRIRRPASAGSAFRFFTSIPNVAPCTRMGTLGARLVCRDHRQRRNAIDAALCQQVGMRAPALTCRRSLKPSQTRCYSDGARWRRASRDVDGLPARPVLGLVVADAPDVEVRGLRVRQVEAADAGRRRHRQALGQAHADARRPAARGTCRA